jgi:hypothetical protein
MPDRDHADGENAQNGTGQPRLDGIDGQGVREPDRRQLEEAAALARAHYAIEPGLRAVYRLEGPDPTDPRIKLLEVNEQTVPTGIVPVGFAAHPASGLHYPSVVIEVTPQEYEALEQGSLTLPYGWKVRDSYERPAAMSRPSGSR